MTDKEIEETNEIPKVKIELTPEQQADEELMQDFLDQDEDIEEITFGL